MPLKKKLFRSNMLFLFLSMVTLLLIGTAVIGACEDRFERTFEEIGYEKMDGDVWDISKDIGKEAIRESFSFLVLISAGCRHYSDSGIASPGIHIYKKNEPSCHGAVRLPG